MKFYFCSLTELPGHQIQGSESIISPSAGSTGDLDKYTRILTVLGRAVSELYVIWAIFFCEQTCITFSFYYRNVVLFVKA